MRVETALTILCGIIVAGGIGGLLWYLISPFTGKTLEGDEPWNDRRWK
jgi:hypothetical protein